MGTVLLVEDDQAVRDTLRLWLRVSFPSLCVLEAQCGEEALATARNQPPDLVLMDYGLPGIDGLEATRRLKAVVPDAHVVMVAGSEAPGPRAEAQRAGAAAFVPKLRIGTELPEVLTEWLAQGGTRRAPRDNDGNGRP